MASSSWQQCAKDLKVIAIRIQVSQLQKSAPAFDPEGVENELVLQWAQVFENTAGRGKPATNYLRPTNPLLPRSL